MASSPVRRQSLSRLDPNTDISASPSRRAAKRARVIEQTSSEDDEPIDSQDSQDSQSDHSDEEDGEAAAVDADIVAMCDMLQQKSEGPLGTIESIVLINFMCHERFEVKFGPNINFVIGENGSK